MPKQPGRRRAGERQSITQTRERESAERDSRERGRKEKWGEAAGGEEEDEADFMRHLFPLKNGREQRARWSVAVVVGSESDDGDDGRAGHFQGHGFARSHEESSAK